MISWGWWSDSGGEWQLAHHCSWNLFSSAASRFFLPSSLHHALRLLAHVLLHLGSCVIFLFFVLSSLSYKPLSAGVPGPGALLKRDRIHFLSPLHTHLLFRPVMLLFFLSKYLFFFLEEFFSFVTSVTSLPQSSRSCPFMLIFLIYEAGLWDVGSENFQEIFSWL